MNADRHLLFGLLALQNEFIDKRQLVAAFGAWMADHYKPLDEILVQQKALKEDDRAVLSRLVDLHVAARGGDVTASLRSLSSVDSIRDELARLADGDVTASISQLRPVDQNKALPSMGQATSSGQRFEIRRPLDRGGLGIVSVALDKELNREVALKEIRDDRADDQSYRTKFILEAEVTGGLEHPGIVPVYGLGTKPDGRPYYAMRLIKGDNLLVHIKRFHEDVASGKEPFDGAALRKLLRRFLDVCQAIDYAHSRGVLHRDLKPGNIMLGKYGETLVVDWGLAKPRGAQHREPSPDATQSSIESPLIPSGSNDNMTVQGSIVGTAAYASPEQLSGDLDQVNERSDIYGLGAMLYELLTGQSPAQGDTLQAVIKMVVAGDIKAPRSLQSQVPKPLEAICQRAIARRPEDRYATAAELRQDIERWLDDLAVSAFVEPVSVRTQRWIRNHRTLVASAVAILFTSTIGLGVFSGLMRSTNIELDQKNTALIEQTKAASEILLQYGETEFLDGKNSSAIDKYVRAWELRENEDPLKSRYASVLIDRLTHGGRSFVVLPHQGRVNCVAFSPDGSKVATASDFSARLWDSRTGMPIGKPIRQNMPVFSVAFHPDGNKVATASYDGTACLWNIETGERIGEALYHNRISLDKFLGFSPDGNYIATGGVNHNASGQGQSIFLWDARTQKQVGQPIRSSRFTTKGFAFSPDSDRFVISHEEVAQLYDIRNGTPVGEPMNHESPVLDVAFSSNGLKLASGDHIGNIRLWDAQSGRPLYEAMNNNGGNIPSIVFSADGLRLFSFGSKTCLWDVESGTLLSSSDEHNFNSAQTALLSPDGSLLLDYSVSNAVSVRDSETGERISQTIFRESDASVVSIALSPDGSQVATASDDNSARIWNLDALDGLALRPGGRISDVKFSPDGELVAIVSTHVSTQTMEVQDSASVTLWNSRTGRAFGVPLRHENKIWRFAFSPDGKQLITKSGDPIARIWDVKTGNLVRQCNIGVGGEYFGPVALTSDGKCAAAAYGLPVRMWNTASDELTEIVLTKKTYADFLAFTPDGARLITTHHVTANLWDAITGSSIGEPMLHESRISQVWMSSNGSRILTATHSGMLRSWDAKTARLMEERQVKIPYKTENESVTFSQEGEFFAGWSELGWRTWLAETGIALGAQQTAVNRWNQNDPVDFSLDDQRVAIAEGSYGAVYIRNIAVVPTSQNINAFIKHLLPDRDTEKPIDPVIQRELETIAERHRFKYRSETALKSFANKNWYTAKFHLPWLIEHEPKNPKWKALLVEVEKNLIGSGSPAIGPPKPAAPN